MFTLPPRPTSALVGLLCLLLISLAAVPPNAARSATATPAPDPSAFSLQLMGRVEGAVHAFDVEGGLMAVIGPSSLTFYDVSDAPQPRALSTLTLPGSGHSVQIEGDMAYVTWGSCEILPTPICAGGFDVYDLAAPTEPLRTARLTGPEVINSLRVFGESGIALANAVLGTKLYRLDLHTPSAPVIRPYSGTAITYWNDSVSVVERPDLNGQRFAYVAGGLEVRIINLTTDRSVSTIPLDSPQSKALSTAAITTANGRHLLYIADQGRGIVTVDLTNPAAPVRLGMVAFSEVGPLVAGPGALYVSTAGSSFTSQLYTFDLTDPTTPRVVGLLPDASPGHLLVNDGHLITTRARAAIALYDLSDPLAPRELGAIPLGWTARAYANGHLFMLDEGRGLMAIDISRPAAPQFHPTGVAADIYEMPVITATGNYLLIGTRIEGWRLFDVTDPVQPRLLSRFALPPDNAPFAGALTVTAGGMTAYILNSCWKLAGCADPTALTLYDLAAPSRPRVLGALILPLAGILRVSGSYAYVVADDPTQPQGGGQLQVLDVGTPSAPRAVSAIGFDGHPQGMAVAEGRVYVAASGGGLHTIAVDDPANPRLLSTYRSDPRMQASSVAVEGPVVFVATSYNSELYTLDLSVPTSPRLVERAKLPGTGNVLLLGDQLVTSGSGIVIYRRGSATDGTVRDARGAPVTDVRLQLTGGAALAETIGTPAVLATDLGGNVLLERGEVTGSTLTPSFRDAAFWPPSHTVSGAAPLDFVMLAPAATTTVQPAQATTLVLTDTQGLTSSLSFPAGALSAQSTVTLRPQVAQAWPLRVAGQAFALSVGQGVSFAQPARLTLRYSRADVRFISDLNQLALYRREAGQWVRAETVCPSASPAVHDQQARLLQVPICAPGEYALLGPTVRVNLPLLTR